MINANKHAQCYNTIVYKFGVQLPCNVKEAKMLDEENGNTHWQDAMDLELAQLQEYNVLPWHWTKCSHPRWVSGNPGKDGV